jgi:Flp pilus assembly pilin Flp
VKRELASLGRDQSGLSTVEYILILVLVAVVGVVTWRLFGASVGDQVDEAQAGITTLEGTQRSGAQGSPAGSAGAAGGAGSASGSGSGGTLPPGDDLHAGRSSESGEAPAVSGDQDDRDPEATQRGSLQAGAGRVTPLRSDGVPSAGDPSAGRGQGGWWKIGATILLAFLAMLAAIPLFARMRK